MARVSAIVVTYHTGPRLKECLYALNADPDISETIIVDNGNPPETSAWLASFCGTHDAFHLLTGHGNIGFGAGINLGVQAASGEDILVINPDAVLRWGSVASLQAAARSCHAPWIIGGKIFDIDGRETRGPRRRYPATGGGQQPQWGSTPADGNCKGLSGKSIDLDFG